MIDPVTVLGLIAAACTTFAFIPQVLKVWRTKSSEDLSLGTFVMFCVGIALWLAYGLLVRDLPVIVSNAVTLVLSSIIVVLALRYRPRTPKPPGGMN